MALSFGSSNFGNNLGITFQAHFAHHQSEGDRNRCFWNQRARPVFCDSSWSSLASQVQQTDIVRLPLVGCSGFLGKCDPWPHFHHAYHSALGQDLLNHNVMQPPPPQGPQWGHFSDPSQSLSAWEILLRGDTVQFFETLWCVAAPYNMMGEYSPTSNIMREYSPKSVLVNIWATRPVGTKVKVNRFKVRDDLNKTSWNFTFSKGRRKEPTTTNTLELHFLHCIYQKESMIYTATHFHNSTLGSKGIESLMLRSISISYPEQFILNYWKESALE